MIDPVTRFALTDLVSDYCLGVDKKELSRFQDIWWPDAIWDIEFVQAFEGIDAITGAVENIVWPMWQNTTHYCANHRFTADGPDSAKGVCDVYCIGNLANGEGAHVVASYYDDFERREGAWRIKRRFVNQRAFNLLKDQSLSPPGG
ncbi:MULTISPECIES: nuclear transport factor 2 family protein [unclassified Sphingobium]|uniref:nuclear transport factor 2 family protein n=1 Tax=unclassified Sphingobium TaxID=2611147 RepID=UPI0035A66915